MSSGALSGSEKSMANDATASCRCSPRNAATEGFISSSGIVFGSDSNGVNQETVAVLRQRQRGRKPANRDEPTEWIALPRVHDCNRIVAGIGDVERAAILAEDERVR